MLTKILVALAVLVIVFVVIVAMRPSEYRVARTVTISAPAPAVFAQVNDFHKWDAWNPWAKMDPAIKQTYEGAPTGTGAVYTWTGNKQVGEGRMTLAESRPSELIRINLEFLKPFAATSTAEFRFTPEGQRTAVTWSMVGKLDFVAKVVSPVRGHGQDDRRQFREGAGGHEVGGGRALMSLSKARLGRMRDVMAGSTTEARIDLGPARST